MLIKLPVPIHYNLVSQSSVKAQWKLASEINPYQCHILAPKVERLLICYYNFSTCSH